MISTTKKIIDLALVITVAEELMYNFKGTTTLEVKTELRNRGYWATQSEVSDLMVIANDQQNWGFSNKTNTQGNAYRVYVLSDPTTIPASVSNVSSTSPSVNINASIYTMRNGTSINSIAAPVIGDWKVSSVVKNNEMYFPGNYTRAQVRNAYRGVYGVAIQDTRSKRIK